MAERHRKFLIRPLLKVERLELGDPTGACGLARLRPSDALKSLDFVLQRLIDLLVVVLVGWASSLRRCLNDLLLLQVNLVMQLSDQCLFHLH